MNYDIVTLGDVCEFLDNQRVPITESERKPGPYPYYGANGQQDSIDSYIFDEPLVLLAEDGGYFGSKDRPIAYKVTGKCWVNNHAHVLRPRSNIDVDYLHRVLSYYDVTKYVNGTTRQKLTKGNAENISFPLPPLTEQKRIASLLARADRLRGLRRTAHDLSDSVLQSVFLEMFGDPVNNDKGWEVKEIQDIVVNHDSKRIPLEASDRAKRQGPYPYYGATGIIDHIDGYIFDRDMLLIAEDGKNLLNRTKPLAFMAYGKYWVNNHSHVVSSAGQINLRYLETALNIRDISSYVTGIDQFKLNRANLDIIPIQVPPLSLQEEFAGVVRRVEGLRGRMSEAGRQVEGLFESLLSESFGG